MRKFFKAVWDSPFFTIPAGLIVSLSTIFLGFWFASWVIFLIVFAARLGWFNWITVAIHIVSVIFPSF